MTKETKRQFKVFLYAVLLLFLMGVTFYVEEPVVALGALVWALCLAFKGGIAMGEEKGFKDGMKDGLLFGKKMMQKLN